MSTEQDPRSEWERRAAQHLVRYEALFQLLDSIRPLEDIEAISRHVARQWKYFANVASWRLTVPTEEGFLVIDGSRGDAHVSKVGESSPWDDHYLQWQIPRLVCAGDPLDGPEPPDHLLGKSMVEIMVMRSQRMDHAIGVLSVASRHEPFNDLDNRFILIFGGHFADRIFDILLRQRNMAVLHDKATRDALTGLMNRGAIIDWCEMLRQLSLRTGEPFSVILADIDHFKEINDRYGHLVGDQVLQEVARRLQAQTRESDHLGRYGGEEFLFVLYPCYNEKIEIAAERYRKAVVSEPIEIEDDSVLSLELTISLGGSTLRSEDETLDVALKRADDALYLSKSSGRNRVTVG